jgi:hypothetical protein
LKNLKILFLFLISSLAFFSCSSQEGVVGKDAIELLKPVKQAEMEASDLPYNLEVLVTNVADNNYSNKNYFKLFVNKQLIQPQNKIDNTTSDYIYRLKLLPGYYDIKGVYYWNDGWKDVKTEIKNKDLIRIDEKGLTMLEKEIPKDWRGIVQGKNLTFDSSYKPTDQQNLAEIQNTQVDSLPPSMYYRPGQPVSNRVKFQINTDPVKCEVYINDELIGSSPISWWVDRSKVHVVQVKADGYRTGIRVVPPEEMMSEEKVVVILRLDQLNPTSAQVSANPGALNSMNFQPQDTVRIDTSSASVNTNSP